MNKLQTRGILQFIVFCLITFSSVSLWAQEGAAKNNEEKNSYLKFLKDIDFTSRLKLEYDDNIFLTETGENADSRFILSQGLRYEQSNDLQYFTMSYLGDFSYYNDEAVDIMSNQAKVAYSYHPTDDFSFGIGHDFTSIEDSNITTTIGDRVVTLGYKQFSPYVQMQLAVNPKLTFDTKFNYSHLDVRNQTTDT
ncbi:MAG: hypothetical protein Q7S13_03675, partial [Candidatus Omnitrophota bacterium]|nr:hypothetical protein [Candidatus Omnitrophota bacterium]